MIFSDHFFCGDSRVCTLQRHIPAPLFRHSFHIDTIPASFEVTICGLGVYELFVNGKRITKGYLAPYRSNPNHFVYYDHYDITPYLDAGENVVGIALGNGIMCCWDRARQRHHVVRNAGMGCRQIPVAQCALLCVCGRSGREVSFRWFCVCNTWR